MLTGSSYAFRPETLTDEFFVTVLVGSTFSITIRFPSIYPRYQLFHGLVREGFRQAKKSSAVDDDN